MSLIRTNTHTRTEWRKKNERYFFCIFSCIWHELWEHRIKKKASNDEKGKRKKKENLLNEEREKSYEKHIFSHIHFRAVRSKAVKSGKKNIENFLREYFRVWLQKQKRKTKWKRDEILKAMLLVCSKLL